ncbi:GNAT family N-acetyltransferase [Leptospira perolatii]|uniref:GNAT family N-acetyltransferase n=1 Tax=Leptospira perolatii TaxID=2023191 RepID=A0A2M9ZIL3_9LEPT|nr:GNAT family N-acetyltransferase [Leptospira perolatii]PJZ68476.1 GNAT family N-acetyltransferase [Leptospira perolatii]PJZ71896.1 GNAT family N-acetyltransferase [Leptospira perolatii]
MNSILHDPQAKKFYTKLDSGLEAHVLYQDEENGVWNIYSTYVPPELRGHGIASDLVHAILEKAKSESKQIIPTCSYVQTFLKRNPEYSFMVNE